MDTNEEYGRALSKEFISDLKAGKLAPLLLRIQDDDTLMLALRGNYINIYYRGGSLLKIEKKSPESYSVVFDRKYGRDYAEALPTFPESIVNEEGTKALVDCIPALKYVMDRFFSKHGRSEREFQQLVARENNRSAISNETEYFIIDIEVAGVVENARFDMLAVRWLRNERKKQGCLVPVLIEMKYGYKALDGKAGLKEHLKHARIALENKQLLVKRMNEHIKQIFELGCLEFNQSRQVEGLVIVGWAE